MRWDHGLDWWALVLAIAALVLAYPLSVLANISSPTIKNWWAERSIAALQKRLASLEAQLNDYKENEFLSEVEDRLLDLAYTASLAIQLIIAILMGSALLMYLVVIHLDDSTVVRLFVYGVIIAGAIQIVLLRTTQRSLERFRRRRSRAARKALKLTVEELRVKLAEKQIPQDN